LLIAKLNINYLLKDFQKLNSSYEWDGHLVGWASCGMGIPARPRLRAGRMPTPQENFEDFFIWKSLIPVKTLNLAFLYYDILRLQRKSKENIKFFWDEQI
jgi:hypothetical protein